MTLYSLYLEKLAADPYDWDTNYGVRFKIVQHKTYGPIIVTPPNGDVWNLPEVSKADLAKWKKMWPERSKHLMPHKRYQIETGKNMSKEAWEERKK